MSVTRLGVACAAALFASVTLALLSVAPAEPRAAPQRSPRLNYVLHCQGCHLPNGAGMPGRVPDMRNNLARFLLVPGGRDYLAQVPGVAASNLSDQEVAALLNWLMVEMDASTPSSFAPYTAPEVARLRAHWLRAPGPVRARLLRTPRPR